MPFFQILIKKKGNYSNKKIYKLQSGLLYPEFTPPLAPDSWDRLQLTLVT